MQKSKIVLIASLTTTVVGFVNILGAAIAYSLVVPRAPADSQTLIAVQSEGAVVPELPSPAQNSAAAVLPNEAATNTITGSEVVFRQTSQRLDPGQAPIPTGVAVDTSGVRTYKWCSGSNPNLPDEVCQAVVSIVANPVESNPHLGAKAKRSLSLLPKNTAITMDEDSWQASGLDSGVMVISAETTSYGTVKIKIFLEKQNNIWVLVDGKLA
jgi:hypothetical protein